ncbi:MAG TPA: DUF5949 family protein [Pseudonocardiaceae bacterium]
MDLDLGMTGWIGEHPGDGGDLAYLLLYPAGHGGRRVAEKMTAAAGLYGLRPGAPAPVPAEVADVTVAEGWAHVRSGGTAVAGIPVTADWTAAATGRGQVAVAMGAGPYDGRPAALDDYLAGELRRGTLHSGLLALA